MHGLFSIRLKFFQYTTLSYPGQSFSKKWFALKKNSVVEFCGSYVAQELKEDQEAMYTHVGLLHGQDTNLGSWFDIMHK